MAETINKDNIIKIEHQGPLTVLEIPGLKDELTHHLETSDTVILSLDSVEQCDSLSIQLLCAISKTAAASGKSFLLAGDMDSVFDMTDRMGLVPEKCFTFEKKER